MLRGLLLLIFDIAVFVVCFKIALFFLSVFFSVIAAGIVSVIAAGIVAFLVLVALCAILI